MHIAVIARQLPLVLRLLPAALVLIGVLACSPAARAAFPGENGKLAVVQYGCTPTCEYDLYSRNPDGTGNTNLTNRTGGEFTPKWSPNGARIAFSADYSGNSDVYVMNSDGTGVTQLTSDPLFDGEPSWSPDGTQILFTSNRDGNAEIYVMNADGTDQTRLTNDSARST
jgi:Tol biopolymer transport system component